MPDHLRCPGCGAPVDGAQRYCVACGAPCSDEPARLLALAAGSVETASAAGPPAEAAAEAGAEPVVVPPIREDRRALTSIALAMFGVVLLVITGWGSNTAETLASALPPGLSVRYPAAAVAAVARVAAPSEPAADTSADDTAVDDTPIDDAPVDDAPVDDTADTDTTPTDTTPTDTTPTETTPTEEDVPPPVKHVFLVVLADTDVAAAAQEPEAAPYLAKTLAPKGTVLTGYRAIAKASLPNSVALVSGQGPTAESAAGCPTYADIAPGDMGDGGQELGAGCVHSVQSGTIGDQLVSDGRTWRAYVEAPAGAECRHPAIGETDGHQTALPGDAAVTWRNPFAYFHTATDAEDCGALVGGLDALDADLAAGAKAPAFAYVVPDRCHDGSANPCAEGAPAGVASADAWLATVVPKILASKAYADDGLLVVTSDRTEVNGADDPACCRPKTYPNLKDAGQGGRVGAVLVSPYVAAGKLVDTSFSHFTLLRTIDDVFGLPPLGYAAAKDAGSLVPDVVEPKPVG